MVSVETYRTAEHAPHLAESSWFGEIFVDLCKYRLAAEAVTHEGIKLVPTQSNRQVKHLQIGSSRVG
ncbi:hypothetical protein [Mycobacterium sp. IS-1742]|uniref:hypothetical protein n=1 Tax=Mycobacterium sp. IS-1742 TaxID=1772285 RepID=UPI0012F78375|nr:hypothetical protein [Mycobacterium sp. IS-1742]